METCEGELETTVLDWDDEEMAAVMAHSLYYTIRSSKYPRTLENPARVTLILNDTHRWSVHAVLLQKFSTKLAALLPSAGTHPPACIRIAAIEPIGSLPAWRIFLTWLYTLDKEPLPDFTPQRRSTWRTRDLKSACFLAAFLGAAKFEKYLLRIVFKEVHDGRFAQRHVTHLAARMPPKTGMHCFANAYLRWRDAGGRAELDPYRWRVEHWYSVCGTVANWGCFHAMNTSGWGGVWRRQEELREKVQWMDEIVFDEVEGVGSWGGDGGGVEVEDGAD
ncbi:hypothetical protein BDV95DRAFT_609738 [Massariosphaeria phaeospora]|uniref:BTB domain-containing protein n=1 Tax=Massariosphaeria phaeospora TaxID=100035 RepID=A0A7C8I5R3_9PLEO|nr:hypothetical protein BDV95DRAFT_609738 [Massariosphaeria phaeospora]